MCVQGTSWSSFEAALSRLPHEPFVTGRGIEGEYITGVSVSGPLTLIGLLDEMKARLGA